MLTDAAWRSQATSRSPVVEAADTLVWQGLASIAIPGFTINRIVWAAVRVAPPPSRIPTLAGLAAIPLIVKPIDFAVDKLLDQTVRKLW